MLRDQDLSRAGTTPIVMYCKLLLHDNVESGTWHFQRRILNLKLNVLHSQMKKLVKQATVKHIIKEVPSHKIYHIL